jgi:hypothetical protein
MSGRQCLSRDLARFYYEARYVGVGSAVGKGIRKLRSGLALAPRPRPASAPIDQGLPRLNLPSRSVLKIPLVVIVSDTQIEQCVLYRVFQKREFLRKAGYRCVVLSSGQVGMLRSYLPLARLIIVYRTPLDPDMLADWRRAGARIAFEFDDLVVGREQVRASGILPALTDRQRASLSSEAARLWETAAACDLWIVATERLRAHYARHFAAEKIHVLPNFLQPAPHPMKSSKSAIFAYTSPSQSIDGEIGMLNSLLASYSRTVIEPYDIIVIGNAKVAASLAHERHPLCTVHAAPFAPYDRYLQVLAMARYVLIPLTDTPFNHCKTAVRALDAARAGVLPLVSPVGAYAELRGDPLLKALVLDDGDWGEGAERVQGLVGAYRPMLETFAMYCEDRFGEAAGITRYRELFDEISQH